MRKKLSILIILLALITSGGILWYSIVQALTAGPNSGTTFGNSGAGVVWNNPSNASTSDNVYATANLTNLAQTSRYLQASGFGFTLIYELYF